MSAGLGCGSHIIKYLLFFFNFLFALCGLLLVVLGALALNRTRALSQVGDWYLHSSALVLVIVGVIIFVVAFYGCCGAVRESNCMLVTFAVLLMVIILVEVVVCVLVFLYKDQARAEVEAGISKLFQRQRDSDKLAVEAVDFFQKELKCCGENDGDGQKGTLLPSSCCGGQSNCLAVDAYKTGCKRAIEEFAVSNAKILGGLAIGVAVVELLGVWFSLGLAGAIKKAERTARY